MKRLLISTTILALSAGAALAADLSTRKAPVYAPPPPMWTGFYAGLNAGYGFGGNNNMQSIGYGGPAQIAAYNAGQVPTTNGSPSRPDSLTSLTTFPGVASLNTGVGYALSGNGSLNQNGFIGGGQIGYNYQWASNFVIGIEADMQGAGISGSSHAVGIGGNSYNSAISGLVSGRYGSQASVAQSLNTSFNSIGSTNVNAGVDWMGTVRGRLGYLVTPTMLVYATGGLTYGGVYANVSNYAVENQSVVGTVNAAVTGAGTPGPSARLVSGLLGSAAALTPNARANMAYFGGGSKSQTLVGWNVGGGLEWMFMPNWSLKAEGIYWNMGNMNVPTASFAVAANPGTSGNWGATNAVAIGGTRVNYQGVIARMGINYHFNWGVAAPIVAKY